MANIARGGHSSSEGGSEHEQKNHKPENKASKMRLDATAAAYGPPETARQEEGKPSKHSFTKKDKEDLEDAMRKLGKSSEKPLKPMPPDQEQRQWAAMERKFRTEPIKDVEPPEEKRSFRPNAKAVERINQSINNNKDLDAGQKSQAKEISRCLLSGDAEGLSAAVKKLNDSTSVESFNKIGQAVSESFAGTGSEVTLHRDPGKSGTLEVYQLGSKNRLVVDPKAEEPSRQLWCKKPFHLVTIKGEPQWVDSMTPGDGDPKDVLTSFAQDASESLKLSTKEKLDNLQKLSEHMESNHKSPDGKLYKVRVSENPFETQDFNKFMADVPGWDPTDE